MTATVNPAQPVTQIRIAAWLSVCGAPGCLRPIRPGQPIKKPPGSAWRHVDCTRVHAEDLASGDWRLA
jgi:hypothetical protein